MLVDVELCVRELDEVLVDVALLVSEDVMELVLVDDRVDEEERVEDEEDVEVLVVDCVDVADDVAVEVDVVVRVMAVGMHWSHAGFPATVTIALFLQALPAATFWAVAHVPWAVHVTYWSAQGERACRASRKCSYALGPNIIWAPI